MLYPAADTLIIHLHIQLSRKRISIEYTHEQA